jgi:hypothetical protein
VEKEKEEEEDYSCSMMEEEEDYSCSMILEKEQEERGEKEKWSREREDGKGR